MSCAGYLVLNHSQVVHVTLEGGSLTCVTRKPKMPTDHSEADSPWETSSSRSAEPSVNGLVMEAQLSDSTTDEQECPGEARREGQHYHVNSERNHDHRSARSGHGAFAALFSVFGRLKAFQRRDIKPKPHWDAASNHVTTEPQDDGCEHTEQDDEYRRQRDAPSTDYHNLLSHRFGASFGQGKQRQRRRRQAAAAIAKSKEIARREVAVMCLSGLTVEVLDKEQQVHAFGGLPHSFQVRTLERVYDPRQDAVDYKVVEAVWFSAASHNDKKMWMHRIGNWQRLGWSEILHLSDDENHRQQLLAALSSRSSVAEAASDSNYSQAANGISCTQRPPCNTTNGIARTSPDGSSLATCTSSSSWLSSSSSSFHSGVKSKTDKFSQRKMFHSFRAPVAKQRSLPNPSSTPPPFALPRCFHPKRRFYRSTTFGPQETIMCPENSKQSSWFQTRVTHSYVVHTEDPIAAAS